MISRLIHAPLCHLITEFHASLLFFHTMTSGENRILPSSFYHIYFLHYSCIAPSPYPISVVFLWAWEEEGTQPRFIAPSPCYKNYVSEIMFYNFEDTGVWGLSNHIVSFSPAYGPPLTLVLLVYTNVECTLLQPYDPPCHTQREETWIHSSPRLVLQIRRLSA